MKNIKKIVTAMLMSTIVIGGLVGCGNSASTNKSDLTNAATGSIAEIKKMEL
jgi:polar amino acid transport system substrate-binding protein